MKITISSKRKELFWSLVPCFVSLNDLRFSSAVCMVGGQLQWGNHLQRAAHDIFFCYKELCIWTFIKNHWLAIVRVLQFWTGNQSLQRMMKEASHQRSEGVGGRDTKVTSMRRYLSFIGAWFIILELCRGQGARFNLGVGFRCVWVWLWGFFSLYEYQLSKFQFKFNLSSGNRESPVDAHMLNNTFP